MKKDKKINIAFLLSLLLHGMVFILMINFEKQRRAEKDRELAIEWVEFDDLKQDELKNVQIVEQEKTINDVAPEDNYKLSKHNQDIAKETRAQKSGEFKNRKNQKDGKKNKASTQVAKKQNLLDQLKPSLVNTQFSASKLVPEAEPAIDGAEISQNDDYLEDVVAGAETLLKTREFVYYSYYNRIKRKLRQHWEPRIKEKIVKILRKGRKIASVNDKITRLVITLDQSGELVRIQVKSASGYNDLDDAAIEAFRAAAPFPNPPQGIVSQSGVVEINWDFVLET